MATELIMAIALLCQVAGGATSRVGIRIVDSHQLACQKYYLLCLKDKKPSFPSSFDGALKNCVLKRKIKTK